MKAKKSSPYLADDNRLGDVIAAIQTMAVYKFYKLPFSGWADRINADENQAEKWKQIFTEHPEFFRLDSERERASLVWRRQFPKRYDVDAEKIITAQEYNNLTTQQKERISRTPLTPSDIKALIDTAVNLHSRALEHQKDKRWWTVLASAAGGLIGSITGALLK
ncbi:N-carbamoyl-L-amino acid amidohydrolase [Ectopseudomonas oleovorans]|uniref:N-carbamoyl-L-amino acid amidohydrolase n=1 Tax=Ectopseudomonas oleovorans TaxID=301 RepID=UPI000E6AB297|nr:N-carbamoyl-L-amino acid amidohydrolase [Pseudomonas oleovorans]